MENYKLVTQACVECSASMHKACMLRLNSQDDVLPCEDCLDVLCNNCYSLSQKYDLCEDCFALICKKCQDREVNLDSNFDPKCRNKLCERCTHTVNLWKLRGIKAHLERLGINNDESSSEEETVEVKPKPSRMTTAKVAVGARAKPVKPVRKEPLQFETEEEPEEESAKPAKKEQIKAKPKPRAPTAKKGSSEVPVEVEEEQPQLAKPKPRVVKPKPVPVESEEEAEEEIEEPAPRVTRKPAPNPILGNSANKAKPTRNRTLEELDDGEEDVPISSLKPATSNKVKPIIAAKTAPSPAKPSSIKKTSANTYGDPLMFE